jgi:hypothetical protein
VNNGGLRKKFQGNTPWQIQQKGKGKDCEIHKITQQNFIECEVVMKKENDITSC